MEIYALAIPAFIAGLITFFAPCTLPLVPAYLGFISGVKQEDLQDPENAKAARKKVLKNGLMFILGFSIVFIAFGLLIGLIGQSLSSYRSILQQVGGVLIIFFGLSMTGVFNISLLKSDKKIPLPKWLNIGNPFSSLVIGGTFALGWTPCVGPILGSILLIASTSGTALSGGILLGIFSLGLGIPFFLVALLYSKAATGIKSMEKYLKYISMIGGVFLVFLGYLLLTDNFLIFIQWSFGILNFLNYEEALYRFL
jgi:cytochrome c-type biogenesis protein